ncbi:SERTA domain-containing protein 2-like isoform X2 [Dendrobates tinctorius]
MAMPTKGIKRKFPDCEESELDGHLSFQTDSYVFFRQSLLNMSLEKFNKGRTMMEPSLRRYVLIANTLRIIQEEIHLENPCNVPYVEDNMSGACDPPAGQGIGSALPQDTENIILPSMEEDIALTAAIASILKELENVLDDSCPQNNQKNQQPLGSQDPEIKEVSSNNTGPGLLSQPSCNQGAIEKEELFNSNPDSLRDIELINELVLAASLSETPDSMDTSLAEQVPSVVSLASGVPDVPVDMDTTSSVEISSQALSVQNTPLVFSEELSASETAFANFDIMNSGYLNDLFFDDPFSDIDTSVFERETAALSSRSSFSEDLWFPSSCSFPSYTSGQGLREPNDLDNIMEILVGS